MSMAMHSSRVAAELISEYLLKKIDRRAMEEKYQMTWNATFGGRLKAGRLIQSLFLKEWLLNVSLKFLRYSPATMRHIIRQTHG
jgi:flavin-dependent dehydrogenase